MAAAALALVAGGGWAAQPEKAGAIGQSAAVSDGPVVLGEPYAIGGVTYTPADPLSYDEVGYASESDGASQGGTTANDEAFLPAAITAAHKTLPLPSYVEVTALDSGRTILVRVNDRGPMRGDRMISLSPGAAAQLGVEGQGAVPVRVRRVNPPEQERAVLRRQGRAAERLETPAALLKVLRTKLPPIHTAAAPPPTRPSAAGKPKAIAVQPKAVRTARPGADFDPSPPSARVATKPAKAVAAPVAAPPVQAPARKGGYVVQVGAFSAQARAEALAKTLGARAEASGGLWRVRLGPYPTQQAAQGGVKAAAAKGFENARIMANDAR
ncbi:septal ring lytic transglycosylase RlpA family protein [Sphingobium sp. CR2-8]|uniref:septal ring lytic transglycosylase RlpA family protein n=1 Tax=Sphingobium sp. CR2-8 TaxID=1306534 RepID=UPI002DBC6D03|nr:septal ring lytic transglycosylase RlpA family protein [Sphingobium sp. CR2-8]MEC3911274.1 septal ring lytic transglycosylase RlpA family protein [Sphingobium sp. CR2-8]